jgi:hypothetical protein
LLFAKLAVVTSNSRVISAARLLARSSLLLTIVFCTLFDLAARSSAQGFLETLFGAGGYGGAADRESAYSPLRRWNSGYNLRRRDRHRHSRHTQALRQRGRENKLSVGRSVAESDSSGPMQMSRRLVCVRSCDAYSFPIVDPGDMRTAQTICNRLCPRSKTKLFVNANGSEQVGNAVPARGGASYAELVAHAPANRSKNHSCSCRGLTGDADEPLAVYSDLTLKPGDSVMTKGGLRVFRGANHFPFRADDFLSLVRARGLTRETRIALLAIEGEAKRSRGWKRHARKGQDQ